MINLGIVLDNFGPSQIAFQFLKNANELLCKRFDVSIFGFYENLTKPVMPPRFALMNFTEVFGFDGILVTTTAIQTYQTRRFPRPSKRIFYSWDLEWVRHRGMPCEYFNEVYNGETCVRNEDHAKLVENCFNIKCLINEDFNLERFL